MQTNIRIIPHTHWDKEWYFTNSRSVIYSLKDFDEIIETLENDKRFTCFILDGQLSIIEEYLELHPYMKERLSNLIKEKRLITGPWYTQPDTLVVSGENLIRNLQYGIYLSKKYGPYQSIGYLPDSFGMSAQIPQIYKEFELDYAFFRRGTARHLLKKREFIWKSLDGTQIKAHNLHHYGNMAYPPNDKDELMNFINEKVEDLSKSSDSNFVLLYNGEDQKPIRKNLPDMVEFLNENTEYDVRISSLEDALNEIFDSLDYQNLEVVNGEFTFGQFSRTHKSIFSSRSDLKKMNNTIENYLTNILEPLCSLASKLGIEYEHELLDFIWKEILLNSAHDSIGNCNSDMTNFDIYVRYKKAESLSRELAEFIMRRIGQEIKQMDITQFQVYNLLPYERSSWSETTIYSPFKDFNIVDMQGKTVDYKIINCQDVSDTYLKKSLREIGVDNQLNSIWQNHIEKLYKIKIDIFAKDIPSFGYTTYKIVEANEKRDENISTENNYLENSRYKLEVIDNEIKLIDKKLNTEINNFISFIDDGDEGDSYDYSTPTHDLTIEAKIEKWHIHDNRGFGQSMHLEYVLEIPKNLEERKEKKCSIKEIVNIVISFTKDEIIKVDIETVNNADEHRFRLVINTNRMNEISYADTQFGIINRPTYLPQVEKWKEEKWDEKPRTIEPMISFVTNGFEKSDIIVFTENVREYQFVGEKYERIALTLFRSTPLLGRANLNDRPGRESGVVASTPDARLMGKNLTSTYYIYINDGSKDEVDYAQMSKDIFTPFEIYQASPYKNNTDNFVLSYSENPKLELEYSLFNLSKDFVLSSLTKERNSDNLLIRYFNPSMNKEVINDGINSEILNQHKEVNLLGNEIPKKVKLRNCQISTLKVK